MVCADCRVFPGTPVCGSCRAVCRITGFLRSGHLKDQEKRVVEVLRVAAGELADLVESSVPAVRAAEALLSQEGNEGRTSGPPDAPAAPKKAGEGSEYTEESSEEEQVSVEIEDEEAPAVVGDKDKRGASKEAPESLEKEAKVEGHSPGEREVSPSSRGRELELYPACKASTKHYKRKLQDERQEEKRQRDSGSRGSRRPVSPEKRSRRASPGHGEEEESEGRAPLPRRQPRGAQPRDRGSRGRKKRERAKEFTRKKIEERRARKKQKQWHQKPK